MLLSDQLIDIGIKADPLCFESVYEAEKQMLVLLSEAIKTSTMKHIYQVIVFVCEHLNRRGYSYYKPEHFITKTKRI